MPTRRTQNAGIHILNITVTGKRHRNIHFFVQDFQRTGYAFFTIRTQTIQKRPANHRTFRTQSPSLQNILTAADTAVHPNLDVAAHRADHIRQSLNGRHSIVKLTAAMIGND